MKPTTLVLSLLATYRITKLVLNDEITRELREKAFAVLDEHNGNPVADKLTYLLGCPWCVSIWAGAALTALKKFAPSVHETLVQSLGLSAATGLAFKYLD